MTALHSWPRVTSMAPATSAFIIDIDADTSAVTKSILADKAAVSLFAAVPDTGLYIGPGSAADSVLIDVHTDEDAGTTKLWWDDSADSFTLSKNMAVVGGVNITGVIQGPAGATEHDGAIITTPTITRAIGRGLNVVMDWSGATGATGIQSASTVSGDGNHGHCYGLQSWMYHTSTGTSDRVAGLMATMTQSAGTVSEWVGLYLPSVTVSAGTLTAAWHIKADSARRSYLPGGITTCDDLVADPSNLPTAGVGVVRVHHDYAVASGGFSKYGVYVLSTDEAAVGAGGVIALGGESGAASTPYPFAFMQGAKEQAGATYNGYLAIHTTDTGSNNSEKARITSGGNLCLGLTAAGTSATKTLAISTGTAPGASPADGCQLYSADQTAGNACLHTRTENGAVLKLYQGASIADAGAGEAETQLNLLLAHLRLMGVLAAPA